MPCRSTKDTLGGARRLGARLQRRERCLHRGDRRRKQHHRIERELVADLLQLRRRQHRRFAAGHQVRHARLVHGGAESSHLVLGLGGFEEDDVGALGLEIAAARQRLVETVHGARVGSRHDQDIHAGACFHGGADLHARLVARNHLLAAGMPALLGADLVFDHDRGGARAGIFDHRALHIERIAITGVAVADQRNFRGGAATVAQAVQHLAE